MKIHQHYWYLSFPEHLKFIRSHIQNSLVVNKLNVIWIGEAVIKIWTKSGLKYTRIVSELPRLNFNNSPGRWHEHCRHHIETTGASMNMEWSSTWACSLSYEQSIPAYCPSSNAISHSPGIICSSVESNFAFRQKTALLPHIPDDDIHIHLMCPHHHIDDTRRQYDSQRKEMCSTFDKAGNPYLRSSTHPSWEICSTTLFRPVVKRRRRYRLMPKMRAKKGGGELGSDNDNNWVVHFFRLLHLLRVKDFVIILRIICTLRDSSELRRCFQESVVQ